MSLDLSVVIVNFNTRQLLEACLASIYDQTRGVSFEVIVVDNASADDSMAMLKRRFPYVRRIENATNNRYAIANNQGLEAAQGRYVLYLNSDTLLQGNTLAELCGFLDRYPQVGGVGGRLVYADGTFQDSCFRFPSALNLFYLSTFARFYWETPLSGNYAPHEVETPRPVDFVVGACFLARRDVLRQCQGMDSAFFLYGEDSDLCYRMRQAGWEIYYFPTEHAVIHYAGASTQHLLGAETERKHLQGWRARFQFIRKHYPLWRRSAVFASMCAAFGVNALLYGVTALKRRDWKTAAQRLRFQWQITQAARGVL